MNFQGSSLEPAVSAWKHEAQCLWSSKVLKSGQSQKGTDGVEVGDRFTLMNLVIYIHFGSSQPPISLKTSIVASLIKKILVITPTNSLKKDLAYSSNIFYGPFQVDFCCHEGISYSELEPFCNSPVIVQISLRRSWRMRKKN